MLRGAERREPDRRFAAGRARTIAGPRRNFLIATKLRGHTRCSAVTAASEGTMHHPSKLGTLVCALLLTSAASAATRGWPAPGPMPPEDNRRLAHDIFKQIVEIRSIHPVVSAEVILTHLAEVKVTHLGEYGGF